MNNTDSEELVQLKKAADGLLCMSESEAPFEPFHWAEDNSPLNTETILKKTGHPLDTPVEVADLSSFFEVATTEQEWHEPEERETVKKFQALVETLHNHLCDLKVYRLGKRNIDIYVIGQTPSGDYAGLSTKVVET
jgi:hypothetical protein